jgi:Fuc2NAc and GlcNAc transferase
MSTSLQLGPFLSFFATAVLAFALTGLAAWYARRTGLLDHPGERHSHSEATPRGGGAGLVASLLISSIFLIGPDVSGSWSSGILPGTIIIASMGAWDDHHSLSVRLRLFIQLSVSSGLVWFAAQAGWIQGYFQMVLSGVFVVWMTNLYNFMDGSNGMAALQGIFGGLVLAFLFHASGDSYFTSLSLLLAACCAGFLPWNLGRAKVFMGDVGSLALGFVFAALLVYGVGTGAVGLPVAMMVMLLFLTDSTLTLLVRVIRGERWYNPHRQHLYQRLIAHGWTHGRVAFLYQAVNAILILPGIVVAVNFPLLGQAAALVSMTLCVLGWFLLVRRFEVPAQAG